MTGEHRPHEVAVLVLPRRIAFEVGLASKFLGGAVDADGRPLYRVRVASLDGGPVRTSAGYSILPEHDASILETARTVVIPGVYGTSAMTDGTLPDELADLLRRTAANARMVSICTGAFVLAAAGLLDGRPATTHWVHSGPSRGSSPRSGSTPTSCSSTTATYSPPPGTPPASTCCCTSSAATTAPRWPTGSPAAASSPRGGTAASRSSSSGRCPSPATPARRPPAPGPWSG